MGVRSEANPTEIGWAALARGAWEDARAAFAQAVDTQPSAQAFEGLAWSSWWLLDVDALFDARLECYRRFRAGGDLLGAARAAIWIGSDYFDFRAEPGATNGWLRRARRLLEGIDTAPEHGWLAVHEASLLAAGRADPPRIQELGAIAAQVGRDHERGDLEMMGLATEGLALVVEGRVDEGMGLLDEARAIALAEEWAYSVALPWSCCYMIFACEQLHDYERAAEWCKQATRIAERQRLDHMWGLCRAHYAGVLVMQGEWVKAESELQEAADVLRRSRPHWTAEATVRLAELRRRQGRLNEASELFRLAESEPAALVGQGRIALDSGDATKARDLAERTLRLLADSRNERAEAIQLLTLAHVALADLDAAAASLAELDEIAATAGTGPLIAIAAHTAGKVALAAGDVESARQRFEDALDAAEAAGLPYEAARNRLEVADALTRLGRTAEAREIATRAQSELRQLGADVESVRAGDLAGRADGGATGRLSPREREVLSLVAQGMSDRKIAAELVLSEHTVHRHVANVMTKLDCSTRAAAVAQATAAGLIGQATG